MIRCTRDTALFPVALVAALLAAPAALAQQDFSGVEIRATHVAGPVHMLQGAGGNIGVSSGPDGILIVDDQYAPLAEKIRTALGSLGKGPMKFVLNTHWHGDHVGGNPVFGVEAPIIAHENVRRRLSTPQTLFDREIEPLPPEGLPVITFETSLKIHFNGEEIRVLHLPAGHTDGDSVVHFAGSDVVHMGDLFFAGTFPFVDLGHGGDVEGLIRNVGAALGMVGESTKIIPGHGPLSTKKDLEAYRRMLQQTTDLVRAKMAEGKDLETIRSEGLPEEWASWGGGFISTDRWIETVHASLSR